MLEIGDILEIEIILISSAFHKSGSLYTTLYYVVHRVGNWFSARRQRKDDSKY